MKVPRPYKLALLIFSLFSMLQLSYSQSQLGNNIIGEAPDDNFGQSVSLSSDGTRLAIGADRNDGNGGDSGHVRIYEWDGVSWVQLGTDIDGEASGDLSGYSVSLDSDGSHVAIGAYSNGDNGFGAGHVRIYEWDGVNWVQLGTDIDGETSINLSGYSVSLDSDGSHVAIGAPRNSASAGHVRIYEWDGASWVQLGIDIDGEASGDWSGVSVSLSSNQNRVAIGATLNDGNGSFAGHVRIYEWNGSSWIQLGADIDGEASGDRCGTSISLSSNGVRVAIGANLNDGNGSSAGHVRIYEWNGSNWIQLGADIDGEAPNDRCGQSTSLSSDGNRVIAGSPGHENNRGRIRVFEWDGTSWTQILTNIDGENEGDFFGFDISISPDGQYAAVSAIETSMDSTDYVKVYDLDAPLPVELLYFRGERIENGNLLGWITESEISNDYFVVEHCIDGSNFYPLSQIQGIGNSTEIKQYNYVHKNPPHFLNYYRLKQVDNDGAFQYSEIISIQNKSEIIEVYPNPTFGIVEVIGIGEHAVIEIYNSIGKKINYTLINNNRFDLSNHPVGVYFIRAINNGELEITKVLKK